MTPPVGERSAGIRRDPPGVGGQRNGEMCGAKKRAKAWAKSHPEPRFLNEETAEFR